ncbi:MAG TPA: hypothetical protein VG407_09275 [Caulobacteraceae bacterium]|jgi:hypothetical protein|nr:hypothetical protein [Caulobacteraceae bacterium]
MDIHKPKPVHGWREFLSEIGVIVLGVLIALALEQAVEWMRIQSEMSETREALKVEIGRNAGIATYSIAEDRCMFAYAQKWIAWTKGGPKPAFVFPRYHSLQSTIWDLSKTGAVTHMPLNERAALAHYYSVVDLFNQNRERERQLGIHIFSIAMSDRLSDTQKQTLIEDANGSSVMNRYQWQNAEGLVQRSRDLGAKPDAWSAADRSNLIKVCQVAGGPPPGE